MPHPRGETAPRGDRPPATCDNMRYATVVSYCVAGWHSQALLLAVEEQMSGCCIDG
jgi:hypothetical protein